MPDSTILFYISAEIAVLLLLTCLFLFFHIGKLKKLIAKFEQKVISLRKAIAKSREETKEVLGKLAEKEAVKAKSFLDYMDEEIESTREYHQSLSPDRDIVLDIAPDAPLDRQAPSLRHAFLIAEKEARYAGEGEESSWDVLQAKLQQIIQFYQSAAAPTEAKQPSAEVESLKQQVEELQGFKQLFHDIKTQWAAAKEKADKYYQQISGIAMEMGAEQEFNDAITSYARSYDDMTVLLAGDSAVRPVSGGGDTVEGSESVGKTMVAQQQEMQRLRNMAVDQHKVIADLQCKLEQAESPEQQQEVMAKLSVQLEQQQRFLQEAETCTQLVEDELNRAITENQTLREQLQNSAVSASDDDEIEKIEAIISDLTGEGKKMLVTIATLEQENQLLSQQLQEGKSGGENSDEDGDSAKHVELLKTKLGDVQQELLNLQTQHIELEERYKELQEG